MDPRRFGEYMGTLVLAFLGNGAVASVVLKKTLGSGAGRSVPSAALFAALGRNPGRRIRARLFLHRPCGPEYAVESHRRDHRHVFAGVSGSRDGKNRTSSWVRPSFGRSNHLGHRLRPRRHHWIRHQSLARSGSTHRARDLSDSRPRQLGFRLRSDRAGSRRPDRRRTGGLIHPRRAFVTPLFAIPSQDYFCSPGSWGIILERTGASTEVSETLPAR
jgi:hypothetical protein